MASDRYPLRTGTPATISIPKDTITTAILVGDMVKQVSGKALLADAIADNLALVGVGQTSSDAGSSDPVTVWKADGKSEFDFPLDTVTTVAIGDKFRISTANSDAQTLQKCLAALTDPVAVCTRNETDAAEVRGQFLLPQAFTVGDES